MSEIKRQLKLAATHGRSVDAGLTENNAPAVAPIKEAVNFEINLEKLGRNELKDLWNAKHLEWRELAVSFPDAMAAFLEGENFIFEIFEVEGFKFKPWQIEKPDILEPALNELEEGQRRKVLYSLSKFKAYADQKKARILAKREGAWAEIVRMHNRLYKLPKEIKAIEKRINIIDRANTNMAKSERPFARWDHED